MAEALRSRENRAFRWSAMWAILIEWSRQNRSRYGSGIFLLHKRDFASICPSRKSTICWTYPKVLHIINSALFCDFVMFDLVEGICAHSRRKISNCMMVDLGEGNLTKNDPICELMAMTGLVASDSHFIKQSYILSANIGFISMWKGGVPLVSIRLSVPAVNSQLAKRFNWSCKKAFSESNPSEFSMEWKLDNLSLSRIIVRLAKCKILSMNISRFNLLGTCGGTHPPSESIVGIVFWEKSYRISE
jgi:hypothetical protein